jgi:CBS domain-containing protein
MSAGRICSREVDTAQPDESAQIAAQRMHARKVGTLVVVNQAAEPMGILTDRDLAVRVVAGGRDPARTFVRDVMTPRPATVNVATSIEDALRTMRMHQCRRIPVVDNAGKLAGILSLDDVLELLSEEFEVIGGMLQEESPGSLAEK